MKTANIPKGYQDFTAFRRILTENPASFPALIICEYEEPYLKERMIRLVQDSFLTPDFAPMNYSYWEGDGGAVQLTPEAVAQNLSPAPLLTERRILVIEEGGLLAGKRGARPKLANPDTKDAWFAMLENLPDTALLVLLTASVDKRQKKMATALQDLGAFFLSCPLQSQDQLASFGRAYLQKAGVSLPPGSMEELVDQEELTLHALFHELDKIILYAQSQGLSEVSHEELADLCTLSMTADIFALMDAISDQDLVRSLSILHHRLERGDAPAQLLFMMARQVRNLMACQMGGTKTSLKDEMKLHPFIVSKIQKQAKRFALHELKELYRDCLEFDFLLKRGYYDQSEDTLDYLIIKACSFHHRP